jgi:cholesterol transport system auxiliary component
MIKKYILLSLLFLFTACSTTVPTVVKYKISPEIKLNKYENSSCTSKSAKVALAFTNSSLISKDMSYVKGNSKVYEYSESAWLNNPNYAVSSELIKMLRDIDIFKSVQESKSRSKADYIIEVNLEDFMQYYSKNIKDSYALVQINLSIIDSETSEVISTKTFRSKVETKTLDAEGGVDALNSALTNVLSESSSWFAKVCK